MSAVKLPEKAGFMPTPDEWDALVRIAENLGAQVVQRDAALMQMRAERDAARAEVARMTERANKSARALELLAHDADQFSQRTADGQALISDDDLTAVKTIAADLRQPDPAQPLDDDGVCKCGHARGQHRGVCMIFPCKCMEFTAPAQGQE